MGNTATDQKIDYKLRYEQSLATLEEEREKSQATITQQAHQIEELTFQLDRFRKYLYGQKNEKLSTVDVDVDQLNLFELGTTTAQQETLSEQVAVAQPKKTPKKRAKGTGRMPLPGHLRREEIIIEPTEDISGCVKIGEDITEVLDLVPAEFYVKRYIRPKYAKAHGGGIICGQLPERVINKGIPSERVIAQMSIDKYVYGLPLHRQLDKYRRLGVNIPASTASDWLIKGWKHLAPLWELLKLLVVNQKYLQADETPIKVQDRRQKNNMHKGYLWIYHAPCDRLVFFDYQKGRDISGPGAMLKGYEGILQTDGYTVYETLYANHPDILLVYCMAHARRKFIDSLKYDEQRANHVLAKMQLLYKLEQQMKDEQLTWEQRTQRRQQQALVVLEELRAWMQEQLPQVLPGSPIGKAIAYALPRWDGLSAYASHGQIEIDNNLAENAIRPVAVGRKNYLFCGSHDAAQMTAAMYSLMATCKKNGVDEFEWLTDVFERIQDHKQKDLYQLLPNNWKKHKPQKS